MLGLWSVWVIQSLFHADVETPKCARKYCSLFCAGIVAALLTVATVVVIIKERKNKSIE